jgi:hypothetical protein
VALANTVGIVPRDPVAYAPQGDLWSVGAFGELLIGGGTAFTSAQHPNAEVIDGTGVTLGRTFGVVGLVSAGSLTIGKAGDYLVELELNDFSCGAASGNVQFSIEYAPDGVTYAAFSATETAGGGGRMQSIRLALTTKESIKVGGRVQRLNSNSKVRASIVSAAGDVITITEGALRVAKVADVDPPAA